MLSLNKKMWLWFVVMSLVLLQALLPFVHAHFGTGSSTVNMSGLHMHTINLTLSDQSVQTNQHLSTINADMQVVAVDDGILKDIELPQFVALCCLTLFVFVLMVNHTIPLPAQVSLKPSPHYRSLSPRAPPYC